MRHEEPAQETAPTPTALAPIPPRTQVHYSRRGNKPDTIEREECYQDYLQDQALVAEEQQYQEDELEAQVQSAIQFDTERVDVEQELIAEQEKMDEFE